jgi:hypothetical protein
MRRNPLSWSVISLGLLLVALPVFAGETMQAAVWQSQLSQHGRDVDARLERAVRLSLPDTSVEDLLTRMSRQTGVALESDPGLAERPLTVYLPSVRLKDTMAELARFLLCYWTVDASSGEPTYTLQKGSELTKAEQDLLHIWDSPTLPGPPPASDQEIEAIAQRLRQYSAAVSLPEADLIAEYGESDPTLVAPLLDPVDRGFVPLLTRLSHYQVRRLASHQSVVFRVTDLPAGIRSLAEQWRREAYEETARDHPSAVQPDPARPPRFSTPEERWAHATLRVTNVSNGVQVYLDVPDIPMLIHCQPIWMGDVVDRSARWGIFRHQHPDATDEETARFKAHVDALSRDRLRREEERQAAERQAFREAHGADLSGRTALERQVVPWPEKPAEPIANTHLLAHIAEAANLPLLADNPRPGVGRTRMEWITQTWTLREALEHWCGDSSPPQWIWSKGQGRFLTLWLADASHRALLSLPPTPERLTKDWDRAIAGKERLGIAEASRMLFGLTPSELIQLHLAERGRRHQPLPLLALWLLGSSNLLERLLAGEHVPITDLPAHSRRIIIYEALEGRPWLTEEDLRGTTLSAWPREAASPEQAGRILILAFHHLPDAPSDYDTVASVPRFIALQPDVPPATVEPAPEEPLATSFTEASLAGTTWLCRGRISFDDAGFALLTNDSTGEMELVKEDDSFRGLTVTAIAPDHVTLTSPDGRTWTMTMTAVSPGSE